MEVPMLIAIAEIIISVVIVFGAFLVVGGIAACMLSSQITRDEEKRDGKLRK
jgi:hypothetical protein